MADEESCSVIGIRGAKVVFSGMKDVEEKETDWANRRPLSGEWLGLRGTVDVLSGRPKVDHDREEFLQGLSAKDWKRGILS